MSLPPSARIVAAAFAVSGTVHLAKPEVFEPLMPRWLPWHREVIAASGVLELACAPDGSRVALASHDGRLLIFDVEAETFTELARGADGEVSGLAFSPDSAWLASPSMCSSVAPVPDALTCASMTRRSSSERSPISMKASTKKRSPFCVGSRPAEMCGA